MFKRKVFAIALAFAMIIGSVPAVYAYGAVTTASPALEFVDMPAENYWSAGALEAAVENGLLNGFNEDGGTFIKPSASLTRAQMAAIVNRA